MQQASFVTFPLFLCSVNIYAVPRCQFNQQKQQLTLYYAERDKAIEKLDKTGADMQQTKERAVVLEVKVVVMGTGLVFLIVCCTG